MYTYTHTSARKVTGARALCGAQRLAVVVHSHTRRRRLNERPESSAASSQGKSPPEWNSTQLCVKFTMILLACLAANNYCATSGARLQYRWGLQLVPTCVRSYATVCGALLLLFHWSTKRKNQWCIFSSVQSQRSRWARYLLACLRVACIQLCGCGLVASFVYLTYFILSYDSSVSNHTKAYLSHFPSRRKHTHTLTHISHRVFVISHYFPMNL